MTSPRARWLLPRPLGAAGAPVWLLFDQRFASDRIALGGIAARCAGAGLFVVDAARTGPDPAREPRVEELRLEPAGPAPRAALWNAPRATPTSPVQLDRLLDVARWGAGTTRLDLYRANHDTLAALRRRWIETCDDPTLREHAAFFADLDAAYHPSRAAGSPTAAAGLRLAQVLQERIRRRGLDLRLGRTFPPDHGLYALQPGDIEHVATDLDQRFRAAGLDDPERLLAAFESFVDGRLHVADRVDLDSSPPAVLDAAGAPNGCFFPSFAESALLFATLPGRAQHWQPRIPPLLAATRRFFATHRQPRTPRSPSSYSPRWRRPDPMPLRTTCSDLDAPKRLARLAWSAFRDHLEGCVPFA